MSYLFVEDGGPKAAVKAVLECVKAIGLIEVEADFENEHFLFKPKIAEWYNCREHGYVISIRGRLTDLHIAFFEHRNSDSLCAVVWSQKGLINPPTIDTAEFGNIYKDKWDVSANFQYNQPWELAHFICERMSGHLLLELYGKETVK